MMSPCRQPWPIATVRSLVERSCTRPSRLAAVLLPSLLALAAVSCDEDFADPRLVDDSRVQLVVVSGNEQNGFVDSPLVRPFRVQVRDERGNPAPQQRVQFRTLEGDADGVFSSTFGVTDYAGFTQTSFTPRREGPMVIEASVAGGPRATFAITAIDRGRLENPAIFAAAGGNGQRGAVGTILPLPLTVRVANEFDQALANFPVLFTATTDGTILLTANEGDFVESDTLGRPPSPSDSIGRQIVSFTDENGIAGALLLLAMRPGTNTVVATSTFASGTPNSVVFTAEGELGGPSSADSISTISGDEQVVAVDTTCGRGLLPLPFNPMIVQITDRFGNPIAGVRVLFRVSTGGGSVSPTEALTDADGLAETIYTSGAGDFGAFAVSATAPGVGTTLFTGEIQIQESVVGDTVPIVCPGQASGSIQPEPATAYATHAESAAIDRGPTKRAALPDGYWGLHVALPESRRKARRVPLS